MKAAEIFKKAFCHLMDKQDLKQSEVADALGIKRPHMNAYLKGTRGFSEDKREEISAYFGMSYLSMLNLGGTLVDGEETQSLHPQPIPIDQATRILQKAMNKASVQLNEKQQKAVVKILREKLKTSERKTMKEVEEYLEALGTK